MAVLAVRESKAQAEFRTEDFDMKRLVWLNYIRWKGTRSAPLDAKAPPEMCIPPENVVNLTSRHGADGSITWDAPAGEWTLLRIGHTWTGQKTLPATPEGEGPECDKLDKRGIRTHFDHVMKRMVELAGPEAGKTFHTFFVDSWEAGGQNWTEKMPEEFKRRRGYDLIPYLPVLTGRVIGDLQTSERFLYDLRQTVSELVTENFWAEMQRLCHARGMRLAVQPYITTGNDLDAANFTDEPMGEFWSHPFQPNDYRATVKAAVSAANLNGRIIVGAEAFTASETERWLSHPATMKELGDQVFCLGANRFQFHRFAMQRFPQLKPGMTMGKWGQHYDSTQTWWEWSKPWHDYLARCQFMLRQGPVVTDVLALSSEEPLHRFEHQPVAGHDYDACGPDTFRRITVSNGKAGIPGGPQYSLITVTHDGTMTLERLRKLRDLVKAGASLLGEPPLATPGLQNARLADAELQDLATRNLGHRQRVRPPARKRPRLPRHFRRRKPSSASGSRPTSPAPRTSHGSTAPAAIPTSISSHPPRTKPSRCPAPSASPANTRNSGTRRPEKPAGLHTSPAGGGLTSAIRAARPGWLRVHRLPPGTSRLQFHQRRRAGRQHVRSTARGRSPSRADSGAPKSLQLDPLVSWSVHPDPNVRHFSGTAVYSNQFEIPDLKSRIILDLGQVEIMARVKVNDKDLGILWKAPYQVDITSAVVPGANRLEISVVNLWVNRLIGDQALPEDSERDKAGTLIAWPQWVLDGKPSPTGRRTFVTFPLWKKTNPCGTPAC